jgi:ABC-type branched-subunit amino acid transport system substrate-binding protein
MLKWILSAALCGVVLGSAARAEDGVTADEIKLGATNAGTGPVAVACTPEAAGALAYFKQLNDAGGVNGRRIKYTVLDDGYSPQRGVGNIRRLTQQDKVLAIFGGCGTAPAAAILPMLDKEEMPYLFPYAGLDALVVPPKKAVFSLLPRYATQLATILPYIIETSKPKTASIFTFNIAGQETVREAVKAALEAGGVKVVGDVLFDVTSPDRTPYALQAKEQGADLLILNDSTPGAARFVLDLERQGWKPKVMTGVSTLTDEAFLRAVGKAADGYVVAPGIVLPPNAPEAASCVTALKAYDAAATPSHYSMFGCLSAKVVAEALKRISGDVTRARLVDSVAAMQDFDTGLSGKITFTPTEHMGVTSIYVFTVKDGAFEVGKSLPIRR